MAFLHTYYENEEIGEVIAFNFENLINDTIKQDKLLKSIVKNDLIKGIGLFFHTAIAFKVREKTLTKVLHNVLVLNGVGRDINII